MNTEQKKNWVIFSKQRGWWRERCAGYTYIAFAGKFTQEEAQKTAKGDDCGITFAAEWLSKEMVDLCQACDTDRNMVPLLKELGEQCQEWDALAKACETLPPGYSVAVVLENGAATVSVLDQYAGEDEVPLDAEHKEFAIPRAVREATRLAIKQAIDEMDADTAENHVRSLASAHDVTDLLARLKVQTERAEKAEKEVEAIAEMKLFSRRQLEARCDALQAECQALKQCETEDEAAHKCRAILVGQLLHATGMTLSNTGPELVAFVKNTIERMHTAEAKLAVRDIELKSATHVVIRLEAEIKEAMRVLEGRGGFVKDVVWFNNGCTMWEHLAQVIGFVGQKVDEPEAAPPAGQGGGK